MNQKSKERTVFGFIGFGLIGGSVAKALRIQYPDCQNAAYNYRNEKHPALEAAKKEGLLQTIYTDLADFSRCDVLFLCAPVIKNVAYLEKVRKILKKDPKITGYSMMINGTEPKKNNFNDFCFTDKGLIIFFNRYQVAPYSSGSFVITVPYNKFL